MSHTICIAKGSPHGGDHPVLPTAKPSACKPSVTTISTNSKVIGFIAKHLHQPWRPG